VEWNVGEVAGMLAAHCLQTGATPHQVQASDTKLAGFQAQLERAGVQLHWPDVRAY
jgi:hypothetical protein